MPVYNYTAVDDRGRSVKGVVDAESVKAAGEKLRKGGVYLSSIKEEARGRRSRLSLPFSGVPAAELAVATRQFSKKCLVHMQQECFNFIHKNLDLLRRNLFANQSA